MRQKIERHQNCVLSLLSFPSFLSRIRCIDSEKQRKKAQRRGLTISTKNKNKLIIIKKEKKNCLRQPSLGRHMSRNESRKKKKLKTQSIFSHTQTKNAVVA